MSKFRKVQTSMWGDRKFRSLSERAKLLWVWLLTGPCTTNVPGVIVTGRAAAAEALGWSPEAFDEAFGEAFAKGMVEASFGDRLVWLPNAARYASPESPNVIRSWRHAWDDVSECELKLKAYHALYTFAKGLGEGFAKAFCEACLRPSPNQEQEQEQEQEQDTAQQRRSASPAVALEIQSPEPKPTATKPKPSRGTRCPEGFAPSPETTARFAADGWDCLAHVEEFADYWRAVAGSKGVKLDWDATFRNRMRELVSSGRAARIEDRVEPRRATYRREIPTAEELANVDPVAVKARIATALEAWRDSQREELPLLAGEEPAGGFDHQPGSIDAPKTTTGTSETTIARPGATS